MERRTGEAIVDERGAAAAARPRPRFFDLPQIQFPVGAITSFGHRVSGVILALYTPLLIYLLDTSLSGAGGYERVASLVSSPGGRAAALPLLWAFAHHVLAGIRHLLMDIDIGSAPLAVARLSAWIVNVAGVVLALIAFAVLP